MVLVKDVMRAVVGADEDDRATSLDVFGRESVKATAGAARIVARMNFMVRAAFVKINYLLYIATASTGNCFKKMSQNIMVAFASRSRIIVVVENVSGCGTTLSRKSTDSQSTSTILLYS
jgi:hypothetical protein